MQKKRMFTYFIQMLYKRTPLTKSWICPWNAVWSIIIPLWYAARIFFTTLWYVTLILLWDSMGANQGKLLPRRIVYILSKQRHVLWVMSYIREHTSTQTSWVIDTCTDQYHINSQDNHWWLNFGDWYFYWSIPHQ